MDYKQNTQDCIRHSYEMVQSGGGYFATLIGMVKPLVSTTKYYQRVSLLAKSLEVRWHLHLIDTFRKFERSRFVLAIQRREANLVN